jgi:RHS repeat-associated protein
VGNLIQRQNNNLGLTENFYYDNVHRLDYSQLNGVTNLDMSYDALGNITSRTDVGNNAAWGYSTSRKHQVLQAGGNSYAYDANGNVTTRNGNTINWTSYNYPSQVNGPGETINLYYDANRQRYKQVYINGGNTETTLYIGGLLQKVTANGTDDYRYRIQANGQSIAIMSRISSGTNATRYILSDYQGSIAKLTDSGGNAIVSESFTAFGARRNPQTWSGQPTYGDQSTISNITREGYTGQTALGNLGLNHMNGRVQDAITGRFLSADPYITEPGNTQNYNRYSYALNNPMSFVDPSGFDIQTGCEPGQECDDYKNRGDGNNNSDNSKNDNVVELSDVNVPYEPPDALELAMDYFNYLLQDTLNTTFDTFTQFISESAPSEPTTCPGPVTMTKYSSKRFVNDAASTILGMADAASFGLYGKLTESLGLGSIDHNLAYNAGLYGTAAVSGGRLIYAGASSLIQLRTGISAAEAVSARNSYKGVFSLLGADHPRTYEVGDMMMKYGSEAEVVKAASRTNATLNTAAAELGYSSASQTGVSGCP